MKNTKENLKERCNFLIERGWTYNKETGDVISPVGRITNFESATCKVNKNPINVAKSTLVWYICTGEIEFDMHFRDGNRMNFKFDNLMTHLEWSENFGPIKQINDVKKRKEERAEKRKEKELLKIEKKKLKAQRRIENEELRKKLRAENRISRINKEEIEKNYKIKKVKENKNYLIDTELVYEIIIAKGKGRLSPKIEKMFYDIVKGISSRFSYYNYDDKKDCEQEAYYYLLKNYENFNDKKFNYALPYFTEVAKRAMAKEFNMYNDRELMHLDFYGVKF